MSRLTESKTGDLLRNSDLKTDLNCKIYARLAAYEDTGLEPETCADYAKAEAEGRLIVLPQNRTIYETDGFRIYKSEIKLLYWEDDELIYDCDTLAFDESAIGKTIFLTREEAEKALKEMQG